MWNRILALCLAMLTVAALANAESEAPCKTGKKCIALLIANAEYNDTSMSLLGPEADAALMSASLEKLGFQAQTLSNASRAETMSVVSDFTDRAREADVFLLYYSGHAATLPTLENELVIVPVDTKTKQYEIVASQSVPVERIFSDLQVAQKDTAVGIVVFDASRASQFGGYRSGDWQQESSKSASRGTPVTRKEFYKFYASTEGNWTRDGGLFARTLSTELESEGDLVRVFGRVREKVLVETALGQDPELIVSGLKGRPFCLASCETSGVPTENLDAVIIAQSQGQCTGDWQRPAAGEPRYALVIGNNGYSEEGWRRLAQPVQDADQIETALTAVKFSTVKCYNLPREKLEDMTERFRAFLEAEVKHWEETDGSAATKPSGFFYFSGHGASRSDADAGPQDYMIPIDSDAATSADLIDKAVSLTRFTANLELIDANAIFVVFDACRNELDTKSGGVDKDYKARIVRRSGMLVAYATSLNTKARETSGYAASLASEIVQPGERATVAFEDAGIATDLKSNGEQIPVVESALRGPYWFVSQ